MDRRNFVKSTLLTGAGAASFGLPRVARAAVNPNAPLRWVFVNLGGGWDSAYSVDPKPGMATVSQPPGAMLQYANIQAWDWRPKVVPTDPDSNVKLFYDAYASMCCIVKGINLRSISHDLCAMRMYTGRLGGTSPDMATM